MVEEIGNVERTAKFAVNFFVLLPRMVKGIGNVVKNAMFVVNFFVLICGVSVFAVGVWALADRLYMERFFGTALYVISASILIATGTIVAIISFLGCVGAIKEIKRKSSMVGKQMRQRMLKPVPLYKNETAVADVRRMVKEFAKAVKHVFFFSNCVILICGISAIAVGVRTLADWALMERLLGTNLHASSASILIATGFLFTIISFLGCFGAIKQIKCMLVTVFIIGFLTFIIILFGILLFVVRNDACKPMRQKMLMSVPLYKNETAVTDAWDTVQEYFNCCGITNNSDFSYEIWRKKNAVYNQSSLRQVPESCCRKRDQASVAVCQQNPKENAFSEDCFIKMKHFINGQDSTLIIIETAISVFSLIVLPFSCVLFLTVK